MIALKLLWILTVTGLVLSFVSIFAWALCSAAKWGDEMAAVAIQKTKEPGTKVLARRDAVVRSGIQRRAQEIGRTTKEPGTKPGSNSSFHPQ